MPKYYRFRATTPTRSPRRKERDHGDSERVKLDPGRSWLDVSIGCAPVVSWYLRRTAWREPPSTYTRLEAGLRSSLQLNSRSIYVFKISSTDSMRTKVALNSPQCGKKIQLAL